MRQQFRVKSAEMLLLSCCTTGAILVEFWGTAVLVRMLVVLLYSNTAGISRQLC